jgi:hypothetical protein
MRRAARKDALHSAVGHIFEQNGWSGLDLSGVGDGVPDWLFIRRSFSVLVEVKTPGAFRPGSKTLERQQEFRARWKACPVIQVETIEAAWKEAETLQEVGRPSRP